MIVLQDEIAHHAQRATSPSSQGVKVCWAVMDRGFALLLTGWVMYAASFFVAWSRLSRGLVEVDMGRCDNGPYASDGDLAGGPVLGHTSQTADDTG